MASLVDRRFNALIFYLTRCSHYTFQEDSIKKSVEIHPLMGIAF